MSVSTDGMIFFGFVYGDGSLADDDDLRHILQQEANNFKAGPEGIKVGRYGWSDGPYYVGAQHHEAFRGRVLDLTEVISQNIEKMKADLRSFCERTGIPYKEPRWLLASYTDMF